MVAGANRRAVGAAVLLFLLAAAAPAGAEDVTTAELSQLIADADGNSESSDRLANVTSLNGQPTDMSAILSGAPGDDKATRLDTLDELLADTTPNSLDGSSLRAEAAEITSKPPFTAAVAGNSSIVDRIWNFVSGLFDNDAAQGLALVAIVGVALLVAIPALHRIVNRRHREPDAATAEVARRDIAAEAEAAAATGDFDAAVRLLFVDGVSYLESRQVVANAATTSTSTVRPIATDSRFLDRFDEIAYGGAPAADQDVAEARSAWHRLKRRFI